MIWGSPICSNLLAFSVLHSDLSLRTQYLVASRNLVLIGTKYKQTNERKEKEIKKFKVRCETYEFFQ